MNNGNSQPNQESNLHFLDYWRIIRIRKWVILSVFLLEVLLRALVHRKVCIRPVRNIASIHTHCHSY